MTAIVGVEHDGKVVMGADSAATDGNFSFTQLASEKVWIDGEWIFGVCGSFRLCQLLRYAVVLPQVPTHDEELEEFLAVDFVDALRNTIVDSGVVQSKNSLEVIHNSDFLIGVKGRVYLVQSDFSIVRSSLGYMATGCGVDLALGSLHSTGNLSAKNRVNKALEAAATHSAAVAAPFVIVESR